MSHGPPPRIIMTTLKMLEPFEESGNRNGHGPSWFTTL
jgi:hypothetical protein